mmetsp:Transcript_30246/g.96638  ORF Transcript_30246/g.96638 Transcript_30246/m.96638 type:complete len:337 (-) Transcript_30246:67-1077(-)
MLMQCYTPAALPWPPITTPPRCSAGAGRHQPSEADLPPAFLDEVLRDKRKHCVRSNPDVESGEAGIEAQGPTFSHDLHGAIYGALVLQLPCYWVRFLLLHLCLDKVEGQGEERGKEAGDGRGAEDLRGARHAHACQRVLARCIERQHAEVQSHSTCCRRPSACHKTRDALFFHNQSHCRGDVGVASPLGRRHHAVSLHADERQVRGVASQSCEAAGTQRRHCVFAEAQLLTRLFEHPCELVEEAQACAGVDHLTRKPSGEAGVEGCDAFVLQHGARNGHWPRCLRCARQQLDAHLDHVHRLDAASRKHPGQRAGGEGLHGLPCRIVCHWSHDSVRC